MSEPHLDSQAVLADLKDFQRRTALWTFERMFTERDPAVRFLVADEVGLGKTHVAKGVIALVIEHLRRIGDERHDIVYVCSNAAIARQNLRKLVPKGIEPLENVERLTMLPLAQLDAGGSGQPGVNLLAITPGTSLKFGRSTGTFTERCLAYTFLRSHWGTDVMSPRARWIFWNGITAGDPDKRLRSLERQYRTRIRGSLAGFVKLLDEFDDHRRHHGRPSIRSLFDEIVDGLAWKRTFPDDLLELRKELIGEVRRVMALVGITALRPDLVVLYGSQSDQIAQLRRAGIATFSYVHGGLAHSISTLRRLGARTGRTNEARQVVSTITSELARLSMLLRERRKPLVLLVFGRQPGSLRNVYASGGVGFLHDMLEAAGGRNVLADLPRESIQLTSEAILTSAAEVIIELTYDDGMTQNSQQAERAVWNELSAVPAVRNRRVYLMLGTHFVQPGPRLAEATEAIARILHPDVVP